MRIQECVCTNQLVITAICKFRQLTIAEVDPGAERVGVVVSIIANAGEGRVLVVDSRVDDTDDHQCN